MDLSMIELTIRPPNAFWLRLECHWTHSYWLEPCIVMLVFFGLHQNTILALSLLHS